MISYTKIERYLRCPYLYKLHYIDNVEPLPSSALLFGRRIHAALKFIGDYYLATHDIPLEMALAFWDLATGDRELGNPISLEDYQRGKAIISKIINGSLDLSSAIYNEKTFQMDFGGVVANGVIDRVDSPDDNVIRAVDYKSGGEIYSGEEIQANLQLGIYAAYLYHEYKDLTYLSVAIHSIGQDIFVERPKTLIEIDEAIDYMKVIASMIERDSTYDPVPGSACLQYGGCWAADRCPAHKENAESYCDMADGNSIMSSILTQELFLSRLKSILKDIATNGEVRAGGRVAELKPVPKYIPNEDNLRKLISEFNLDPFEFMSTNFRMFEPAIERIRDGIRNADIEEMERDYMLDKLDMLAKESFTVDYSAPRLSIHNDKG